MTQPPHPDDGKLMARAGETLTCAKGHKNYKLLADIRAGEVVESANLEPVGFMPAIGMRAVMPACVICGQFQARYGPIERVQICVDGEWRGDGNFLAEKTH